MYTTCKNYGDNPDTTDDKHKESKLGLGDDAIGVVDSAVDIHFDFQAEAGLDKNGKQRDSDRYSPTLQEYHRILWSKPLPNGEIFKLTKVSNNRLYHGSKLGEFYLSSDRAIATAKSWQRRMDPIIEQIPADALIEFKRLSDSIGGIVIWPSNRIDKKLTINGARGLNLRIADRLDLTIECIRLYYHGEESPLYETLDRYKDFFKLFDNFKGYIDFFLLQDYVSADYHAVHISQPFNDFQSSPVPKTLDEYYQYVEATSKLIHARNQRIKKTQSLGQEKETLIMRTA